MRNRMIWSLTVAGIMAAGLIICFALPTRAATGTSRYVTEPSMGSHVSVQIDRVGAANGSIVSAEGTLVAVNPQWVGVKNDQGTTWLSRDRVAVIVEKPASK